MFKTFGNCRTFFSGNSKSFPSIDKNLDELHWCFSQNKVHSFKPEVRESPPISTFRTCKAAPKFGCKEKRFTVNINQQFKIDKLLVLRIAWIVCDNVLPVVYWTWSKHDWLNLKVSLIWYWIHIWNACFGKGLNNYQSQSCFAPKVACNNERTILSRALTLNK